MVTIKDGCGAASCCSWKEKLEEAYKRATASVNKIGDDAGSIYYPDGTGYVKLPLPTRAQVAQIQENADDIATLKQRATVSEGDIDTLEQDVARIDAKDTAQDTNIKDNSDRITSTNNDLVATEATVAAHDSDIITLKAQTVALGKSLVSDVLMTDGTTAGSVQVSIEREDGALITSANYKWGRDIGVRLEAGTQAGYIKTVISLSDGTELESNEYKIVEVLESDVYVTAITLVPDMTAGTIGGNISYSNGTTQTINAVNVPTAPGVTSAIEALQSRMTAVENTNNTQSSEITALTNRVQAIEDTPGVGQFGAGKLGTIAGSTVDGRVAAEDDGTGSVNGWSALKQRVTTAEGQIVTAQNDISSIKTKNTQQDTAISGLQTSKVNVAQGAENAGKALVVGEDGNVSPVTLPNPSSMITLYLPDGTLHYSSSTQYSTDACPFCAITRPLITYNSFQIIGDYYPAVMRFEDHGRQRTVTKLTISDPVDLLNLILDGFNITLPSDGEYIIEILPILSSSIYNRDSMYCTVPYSVVVNAVNGRVASLRSGDTLYFDRDSGNGNFVGLSFIGRNN